MPEVGGQTGQMVLDIDPVAVPPQQRLDSKSLAQVMQTGTAGIRRPAQADFPGQLQTGVGPIPWPSQRFRRGRCRSEVAPTCSCSVDAESNATSYFRVGA